MHVEDEKYTTSKGIVQG